MTAFFAWTVTALVVVVLLAFLVDVASLRALSTEERPRTATYDRLGRFVGDRENPDYHENPAEAEEGD